MAVAKIPSRTKPVPLARTRPALAAAATADTVLCLWVASIWLTFGAAATSDFGRLACGEGCRVVAAASEVSRAAFITYLFLCPVALPLFITRLADSCAEADKVPAPKNIAAALKLVLRNRIVLGGIASVTFMVLMFLDNMGKNSPGRKRIGSLIRALGGLCVNAIYCFLCIPTLARMVWRMMKCVH